MTAESEDVGMYLQKKKKIKNIHSEFESGKFVLNGFHALS